MRALPRYIITVTAMLVAVPTVAAPIPVSKARVWERWEQALQSTGRYDDPARDVRLQVVYEGPGKRTLRAPGFWDGDRTFRVRCAFPAPGRWRWRTTCSDTTDGGLHGQTGIVDVTAYKGPNPLYRHGFLRVSANGRFLCHADRTPFLWIGDTAWAVPFRATAEEWAIYLADRVRKRFTVTQVGLAPWWSGDRDSRGNRPFLGAGLNRPNPAFWRAYEAKIEAANRAGLMVMLAGVMEPTTRYPDQDEACRFARYLAARLYGSFVVFSPSFDSGYMPLGDAVGAAVREATSVHLITQHPGTPSGRSTNTIAEAYRDKPYMDFAGNQTGHNGGNRERCARQAIEWNLSLWNREPARPVINLEAMYDAHGSGAWTADDARSLGWRSWLSGAKGYTYGAGRTAAKAPGMSGGLWFWVTDPSKPDYWRKALGWASSDQMTVMHDFLASIEWWRLEPAYPLIHARATSARDRICASATPERDLVVAYLPSGDGIPIDLTGVRGSIRGRWLDPVTGKTTPIRGRIEPALQTLAAPSPGEWVLVIQAGR